MSDFAYTYARPSALEQRPDGNALLLSAFAEEVQTDTSCFFWGRLRNSWLAARPNFARVASAGDVRGGGASRARITPTYFLRSSTDYLS
ncbi:hypothetical protein N008_02270 [Hymenobacter sp. APR13]|nr:hypothetical protein N008_02270 [Hymenobacter sp. APR13]